VETIKKNKVIVDVLTEQMTEIDEEIRVTEYNMLPSTPVRNNGLLRKVGPLVRVGDA
jgi:hypothetical protein